MHATRKTITLPSGATVTIRKMKGSDFIELGEPPAAFAEGKPRGKERPPTKQELDWGVGTNRIILTRCVGPVSFPDGTSRRIVDKPFADCPDSELSIDEMDDADGAAIINAVSEFTSVGKEAAQKAQPFLPEQTLADSPGPDGAEVSRPAELTPATGP